MAKKHLSIFMTTLLSVVGSAQPGAADDWQLTLSPYIWAVSMDGDLTARGNKVDIDASFGDILDASDSILAFNTEIALHNGRFGFMLGPNYAQLGVDDVAEGTILESDVTMDLLFVDAAAAYRLVDWPMESTTGGEDTSVTFDAYAGVRYTRLETEIDFDAAGSPDGEKDWWDPIIGGDASIDLTPRWFLRMRGDFGGFGAGSDFTALGLASIGYRFGLFGRDAAVAAGYRAIFQDYDEDSGADRFEWDMTIHGPTLGLITHWG